MPKYAWSTFSDLVATISFVRRDIQKIREFATLNGAAIGTYIEQVYDFAGADDATSSAKGGEAQRIVADLDGKLHEAETVLNELRHCMKRADGALQEAEARRKVARAKLGN